MAIAKINNIRSINITTNNLTVNKKANFKRLTVNNKPIPTKEDINELEEKINLLKENIKQLRAELNMVYDYDIDKPGTQDMDGETTFYINTPNDIIEAITNSTTGDDIQIQSDISITETGQAMIFNNKNVMLNLNNKTLTSGNSLNDNIRISNGVVTINGNGVIDSKDPYDSQHSTTIISANQNGKLILDGAKITAVMDDAVNKGQFGIGVFDNGNVVINNADITTGWYCITGNGTTTNADSIVTINDGNLTSTVDYAIYHPDNGTLIVNGGAITGGAGAISANAGNIIINGGILKTVGDGDTGNWNDGTSGQTPAVLNLNGKYGAVYCEINGGTFIAMNNMPIVITGTKYPVNVVIKGGRYSQKPKAEWIAKGYAISDTTDEQGFYVVKEL